jgi:hypothetical protein
LVGGLAGCGGRKPYKLVEHDERRGRLARSSIGVVGEGA